MTKARQMTLRELLQQRYFQWLVIFLLGIVVGAFI